jgi:hypothetical protein
MDPPKVHENNTFDGFSAGQAVLGVHAARMRLPRAGRGGILAFADNVRD